MCHSSPAVFLVWGCLSSLLCTFLLFHLWSFDRFRCLMWNNGPYSGAFKRLMTYSFMTSIPLLMVYSIGFAVIKYQEGFIVFPFLGVIPKPYQLWTEGHQRAIFPLYLLFSMGWAFELVTHLEELCFWFFLVNVKDQHDWFGSYYFKTWAVGSMIAIVYMPLVTILTRQDPLKCEAHTFLAGSLASLVLTISFCPILRTFPSFLENLKKEGVDNSAIVRLTKFHELNTLRIAFRFLFTICLLILAVDGVRPHPSINLHMASTDALAILAAIGVAFSNGLTIVIFFPRSYEGEIAAKEESRWKRSARSRPDSTNGLESGPSVAVSYVPRAVALPSKAARLVEDEDDCSKPLAHPYRNGSNRGPVVSFDNKAYRSSSIPLRPNRYENKPAPLSESNVSLHNQMTATVNPMVYRYTSPINLAYAREAYQADPPLSVKVHPYARH